MPPQSTDGSAAHETQGSGGIRPGAERLAPGPAAQHPAESASPRFAEVSDNREDVSPVSSLPLSSTVGCQLGGRAAQA